MHSNLDRYKADLKRLVDAGGQLLNAMYYDCHPEEFDIQLRKKFKTKKEIETFKTALPNFKNDYQAWYSESLSLVKFALPDRVADFTKLYEKPKTRKQVQYGNYVIEDYLQSLRVTSGIGVVVDRSAAVPQFEQQLNIVKSVERRFESALFDVKQIVQADLFDSELDAAKELNKKGFARGAGAIAGVVLEKHLAQVCGNHNVTVRKKNPSINDLNEALKGADVIEVPVWRSIQHLGDLRNLCDHNKDKAPTIDQVNDLIEGVAKIIKTTF